MSKYGVSNVKSLKLKSKLIFVVTNVDVDELHDIVVFDKAKSRDESYF